MENKRDYSKSISEAKKLSRLLYKYSGLFEINFVLQYISPEHNTKRLSIYFGSLLKKSLIF